MNYATKYRALIFKQTQHRLTLGCGTSLFSDCWNWHMEWMHFVSFSLQEPLRCPGSAVGKGSED